MHTNVHAGYGTGCVNARAMYLGLRRLKTRPQKAEVQFSLKWQEVRVVCGLF